MKLKKGPQQLYEDRKLQKKLRKKHRIEKENVIVVEKSRIPDILLSAFHALITITLFALAATGIVSLIYPAPRTEIIEILTQCIETTFQK